MDFLMNEEIRGFAQDYKNGNSKQTTDKILFEQRLLDGLGEEMDQEINNPDSKLLSKKKKIADNLNRKKRWAIWKENLLKILGKS